METTTPGGLVATENLLESATSFPKGWTVEKIRERAELFLTYHRLPHLTVTLEGVYYFVSLNLVDIHYDSDKYIPRMRKQSLSIPLSIFMNLCTEDEVVLYFEQEALKRHNQREKEQKEALHKQELSKLQELIEKYPDLASQLVSKTKATQKEKNLDQLLVGHGMTLVNAKARALMFLGIYTACDPTLTVIEDFHFYTQKGREYVIVIYEPSNMARGAIDEIHFPMDKFIECDTVEKIEAYRKEQNLEWLKRRGYEPR